MLGKSSAVSLLLWLLVAPFFNQIDGNNTVSPSKNILGQTSLGALTSSFDLCTDINNCPSIPRILSCQPTCRGCSSCSNGLNGHNGLPGRDGRDGAKGEMGVAGPTGSRGVKGENGMTGPSGPSGGKGEKGMMGTPGPRGGKGEMGPNGTDADHRNWKQCAWKKSDNRDIGLIQDCIFTKKKDNTALRVVFQGNIYLGDCGSCCKRWFITFNGAECSGPLPIDVAIWIRNKDEDNLRPGAIEGYCDNIHKGNIRVGINIGNCPGYGNSNGRTGWMTVSRLIIEEFEVPRSQ